MAENILEGTIEIYFDCPKNKNRSVELKKCMNCPYHGEHFNVMKKVVFSFDIGCKFNKKEVSEDARMDDKTQE